MRVCYPYFFSWVFPISDRIGIDLAILQHHNAELHTRICLYHVRGCTVVSANMLVVKVPSHCLNHVHPLYHYIEWIHIRIYMCIYIYIKTTRIVYIYIHTCSSQGDGEIFRHHNHICMFQYIHLCLFHQPRFQLHEGRLRELVKLQAGFDAVGSGYSCESYGKF